MGEIRTQSLGKSSLLSIDQMLSCFSKGCTGRGRGVRGVKGRVQGVGVTRVQTRGSVYLGPEV